MSQFLQLHLLTSYPPANLNRDDLGRPKTARMGGSDRLRISSQSLKRCWRTSDLFESGLKGHRGTRTKRIGVRVYRPLVAAGVEDSEAKEWARSVAEVFGKLKKANEKDPEAELEIEQLAHLSPEELSAVDALAAKLAVEKRAPTEDERSLLRHGHEAVDIALFGRMLASYPKYNVDAACQVAHAITVHRVAIEDDYFTAVDDLNEGQEDVGAGHIGEAGFAAGLFYIYICLNRGLLVKNLNGDRDLASKGIAALTEAALKVAPKGKQNSFGSRAYASFVLAERGDQQPRSLAVSFLEAIHENTAKGNMAKASRQSLLDQCSCFDTAYGACAESRFAMDAVDGGAGVTWPAECRLGSFEELIRFASGFDEGN